MTLVREVVDGRGRLLIPAGRQLSERHVVALRAWGIRLIEVEGDETGAPDAVQLPSEIIAAAEARVDERFAIVGQDDSFLAALREQAVSRTAKQMVRSGVEVPG